ncbi:hypothetical protein ACCS75_18635 [Rhizobium ruizarguesonis]
MDPKLPSFTGTVLNNIQDVPGSTSATVAGRIGAPRLDSQLSSFRCTADEKLIAQFPRLKRITILQVRLLHLSSCFSRMSRKSLHTFARHALGS